MGAGGFLWVRWGAGTQKHSETRQRGGIYGPTGQDLGSMVGEISPDMMFCGFCQKWPRVSADG